MSERVSSRRATPKKALPSSEERWQAVFQNPRIGVALVGADRHFVQTNPAFRELVGYSEAELTQMTVPELTHPDDRAAHEKAASEIRTGRRKDIQIEKRYLRKGGGIVWVRSTAFLAPCPEGGKPCAIALVEDITEPKLAQERLRKQEWQFLEAQRLAHFGSWERDTATDEGIWSDELYRILGVEPGSVRPTHAAYLDRVASEDRERVRAEVEAAIESRRDIEYEARIVRPDGGIRIVQSYGSLSCDAEGKVTRVIGILKDVTDRKRAEERSRESEGHYRLLFESNPSPMWVIDEETFQFLAVNNAAVRHYGYSREEFLSMKATDIRSPEDAVRFKENFQRKLEIYEGGVWRHRKKDGTEIQVEGIARAIEFAGRPARLALIRDVTERRRAEARLARSAQEMRALTARLQTIRDDESARIAREVHDEVGQALTALAMDVAWLGGHLGDRDREARLPAKLQDMAQLLETTSKSVERIASDLRPAVLDELGLEAAAQWAVRRFEERTKIPCRFESLLTGSSFDPLRATAAFKILQEALTNISRHAHAHHVSVQLYTDESGLHLEVQDDGVGIDPPRIGDSRSFGLLGMRERARAFDGNCVIAGRPTGGTTVSATIPLSSRQTFESARPLSRPDAGGVRRKDDATDSDR
jgi:PAS domain S-box-containing protein